jgi:hypothetical protein
VHDEAGGHLAQEPPQSTPVSSPFCVRSVHDEAAVHLAQEPPQSTPVSSPFCVRSVHDEAAPGFPAWFCASQHTPAAITTNASVAKLRITRAIRGQGGAGETMTGVD